jgi:hypothetical protein
MTRKVNIKAPLLIAASYNHQDTENPPVPMLCGLPWSYTPAGLGGAAGNQNGGNLL